MIRKEQRCLTILMPGNMEQLNGLFKVLPMDITLVYIGVVVLTGFLFLFKFQVRKPGLRGLLLMVAVGAVEFALLLAWKYILRH